MRPGEALDGLRKFYGSRPAGEREAFRATLRQMEADHRKASAVSAANGSESEAIRHLRAAEGLAEFVRATEEAS